MKKSYGKMKNYKNFMALLFLFISGCGVDPETAQRVLHNHGIENVRVGDYAFGQCSRDDTFASYFSGERRDISEDGTVEMIPVEGVICCGIIKLCTVRF
jgi:hypothetical protein